MILQVFVANLTVVFLSWMIEKTANLGLGAVTGIMCIVGAMMFLLPPVPGVPVYLTLGIVLPAQGHTSLGKSFLFFLSIYSHDNVLTSHTATFTFRMDWLDFIFNCRGSFIETLLECFTTKDDRPEFVSLCQSKAVCWNQ